MTLSRIALGVLAAAIALPAAAADYSYFKGQDGYKDAPMFKPSIHDWTGAYAGVHGGWSWGDHRAEVTRIFGLAIPPVADSASTDGLMVGGQVGYRSQDEGFVWGVEADLSYIDHGVRERGTVFGAPFDARADMNVMGSVRLVAGVPIDNILLYATGGLAGSRLTFEEAFSGFDYSKFLWGWTGGLGAEAAVSPDWTVRGEWLYTDFGETDHSSAGFDVSTKHSFHTLRLGVNYRFY